MRYPMQIIKALKWHIAELASGDKVTFGKISFWAKKDYKGELLLYATLINKRTGQTHGDRYGVQIGEINKKESGHYIEIYPSFKC